MFQGCLLEAALTRGDQSDEDLRVIGVLLPAERGRKSRPAHDNRQFLNGMLHALGVGCPWRDMDGRYGKWTSVYSASAAGRNEACGMRSSTRWSSSG